MKKTIASAVVTLLLGCGAADANTIEYLRDFNPHKDFDKQNFYFGLQAGAAQIDDVDSDVSTLTGTVGFFYKWGISLEGRFAIGSDQATSLLRDPVSTYTAGMLRYHYTWNQNIMAYAGLGAGIRVLSDDVDANSTVGLAAALGLNLFGNKTTALNIEYTYQGGRDDVGFIGIGFQHYLGKF